MVRLAVLCLLQAALHAQSLLPSAESASVFFDGGRQFVVEEGRIKHFSIGKVDRPIKVSRIPEWVHHVDYLDGRFWSHRPMQVFQEGQVQRRELEVLSSPDALNWHPEAIVPFPLSRYILRVSPLGNGRFLLETATAFTDGASVSKWAWGEVENSVLRYRGIVPMEWDGDLIRTGQRRNLAKAPQGTALPDAWLETKHFGLLTFPYVGRQGNRIAFASARFGWIWLFQPREAGPTARLVRLYSLVNEKAVVAKPGKFETVLLGLQPLPDGDFLMASRSEDAVRYSREFHPLEPTPDLASFKDAALMDRNGKAIRDALAMFPEVRWWRMDPESGKVSPVERPDGFPKGIPDIKTFMQFRFRAKLNGNLEIW